jgi:hypothetical protein
MKIRDIIGEEASMVVKDFKPGQSLSMVDPATDTMTVVDLKKNPAALTTNDQGEFMFDPTPDTGAPGEPKQPEIKPGAQIKVDTATSEGMSDVDLELRNIVRSEDEEELIDAIGGLKGNDVALALEDMMANLADELAAKGMNHVINDEDKMIELLMDRLVDEYGNEDDDVPFTPDDNVSDKDQFGNTIKNKARHLARMGMNKAMGRKEGMAPGTALDVKNERMDESAMITALARRISGVEVKTQIKSKEVFDIKKLAGL